MMGIMMIPCASRRRAAAVRAGTNSPRAVSATFTVNLSIAERRSPSGGCGAEVVFPCERLADDDIKVSVGWGPAKRAANFLRPGHHLGRIADAAGAEADVARARRGEADVERPARGAPDGLDDLQHRKAAPVAAVEGVAGAAGREVGEGGAVRARQIAHLDIVANTGAVGRRVVGAKDVEVAALAERGLAGDLDEVRCARRRLSRAPQRVGAGHIEVA